MKKKIQQFKEWKLKKVHKWAQWYADLIIKRLGEAKSDWEFNFWLTKGHILDVHMIENYEIYLD